MAGGICIAAGQLGMELNFEKREVCVRNPQLPNIPEEVHIRDLQLAGARINLRLRRRGATSDIAISSCQGDITAKINQ
jgi:hypothetical protein